METYRQHILWIKKNNRNERMATKVSGEPRPIKGSARSLIHYRDFIQIYLHCKRIVLAEKL